ncbi:MULTISPECIES: tautomerase family protein [Tsukamurella]|uniref:4-oxalocrotonate tautomerase n=2 Tax=Tsukamurella TaxID=2060 RepID=A0A5C5RWV9_9ACTN|nr:MULTISPECIES: tautomerase family protein [Tsukamurella]NMD55637.1 4-oxalocrotonate tautomerase [Tsukamurella columbiensis]TWS26950.1 4-oxalocrotonate tautomerase [Tsukamurella conjunctivitidis]
MPLWNIHHTPGVFTSAEKESLAATITDRYAAIGLPRFYVVVLFHEVAPQDFFIGGASAPTAVRIAIDHIARHASDSASRTRIAEWVRAMVAPALARHPDLQWEFHVDDTSEEMWMINGLVPPPAQSEAERDWVATNRTAAY